VVLDTTSPSEDETAENGAKPSEDAGGEETPEERKRIAFATDITSEGAFGPEWLVVENEKLYVFAPNGGTRAHLRHVVPLRAIKEAKAEVHVGNGEIEVGTKTETISLLRFSQAVVGEAHTVARQINALVKGQPPPVEKEEDKKKFCPKCKRVLP